MTRRTLSPHTAQAFETSRERRAQTANDPNFTILAWGRHTHAGTAPASENAAICNCPLNRFDKRSRDQRPEKSLPAFASENVAPRIRCITQRPSLPLCSLTGTAVVVPCDTPTPKGVIPAYHVAQRYQSGLGLACLPGAQHLRQTSWERLFLTPYLLVQA